MEVPCKWIIPFYKPYTVYTHQGSFWTFWSCSVAFQWKIGQKTKYSPKNHVNQPNADVDRSDGSVFFWLLQRCKTRFEIWSLLVSRGDPAFCTRKGMLYCSQPSLYCSIAVLLYCCIAVLLYCCITVLLYCCIAVLLYCSIAVSLPSIAVIHLPMQMAATVQYSTWQLQYSTRSLHTETQEHSVSGCVQHALRSPL